jgi:hypothetical protein
MFRESTVRHQEVRCVYVANGTSKMTVGVPECNGLPFHPGLPTVILEVLTKDRHTIL